MISIWKYVMRVTDSQSIDLPLGAIVLTAQMQSDALVLWAIVDTDEAPEPRAFRVVGTGHRLPHGGAGFKYISTVQHGSLVWHIFEDQR